MAEIEIPDEQIAFYEKPMGIVRAWNLKNSSMRKDALWEFNFIERVVYLRDAFDIT